MEFFSLLLQASINASIAIVIVCFLRLFLKNEVDRRSFIVLWTVIVACMFVAPLIAQVFADFSFVSQNSVVQMKELLPNNEVIRKIEQIPTEVVIAASGYEQTMMGDSVQGVSIWFVVWIVGVTVLLTSISLLYALFYRQCQKSLLVSNIGYEEYLNGTKVYLNDQISSPVTIGFFKSQIHLPAGFDLEDKDAVRHVLFHELVHIKRRDNLSKLAMLLAVSLHWFNPFVWILFRLFNKDLEFSCDNATINIIGQENKAKYANTLVNMAEQRQEANVAGLVFVSFEGNFLKERVLNIMKSKRSKVLSMVFTVFLALGVFSFFVVNSQSIDARVAVMGPGAGNYIGIEQAKAIAIERAGGGQVIKSELDYEDHGAEYELIVVNGDFRYDIDINAYTGTVMKMESKNIDRLKMPVRADMISPARAKEIAIGQAGGGIVFDCELDYDDGMAVYEIELMRDNVKYEYDINAYTGSILKSYSRSYNLAS